MKKVLHLVISESQSGFLKGKFIGDNLRLIYDVISYTQELNIPGMLLLVDFATAFDSISWQFMLNVLKFFTFGENFLRWIQVF